MEEEWGDNCQTDKQMLVMKTSQVNDISHLYTSEPSISYLADYTERRLGNFLDHLTPEQELPFEEFTITH